SVDGYHDLIEQNVASSDEREPVPVAPAGQIDTAEPGWIERVGVRVPVPPDRTVALAVCLARAVVVTVCDTDPEDPDPRRRARMRRTDHAHPAWDSLVRAGGGGPRSWWKVRGCGLGH